MHRAVDRCPGAPENADDDERLVGVFGKSYVSGSVIEHDPVAEPVAKALRHLGAGHRLEQAAERPAVRASVSGLGRAVAEVIEVRRRGPQDRVAAVRIAQRQRDRPRDQGMPGDCLVAVPAHVIGRLADAKHGVEHQLHRTRSRADDQIRPGNGLGETLARLAPDALDAQQQSHAQRDRDQRQTQREPAIPGAAGGERDQVFHAAFLSPCARLIVRQSDFTAEIGGKPPIVADEQHVSRRPRRIPAATDRETPPGARHRGRKSVRRR